MLEASCPSCGAPLQFKNKASLWVICGHCDAMALRKDMDLEAVGKVAHLQDDGSPIQLETRGEYKGKRFEVIGRIQLQYPQGFWNEWFLDFEDGRNGWLGEAQGDYAVSFLIDNPGTLPGHGELKPGMSLSIASSPMEVRDIQTSRCISGEGELPFQVRGGYEAPVADLSGQEGKFATVDYSEEPPIVFVGEYVEFDDLRFVGLREFEDW